MDQALARKVTKKRGEYLQKAVEDVGFNTTMEWMGDPEKMHLLTVVAWIEVEKDRIFEEARRIFKEAS